MASDNNKWIRRLAWPRAQRLPELGTREVEVLDILWASHTASAQEVLNKLGGNTLSLSTVQSTLERLHRKQLVERHKVGRAYRYRALMTQSQLISGLMNDLADDVAAGKLAPMLSGFVDYLRMKSPALGEEVSQVLQADQRGDTESADD